FYFPTTTDQIPQHHRAANFLVDENSLLPPQTEVGRPVALVSRRPERRRKKWGHRFQTAPTTNRYFLSSAESHPKSPLSGPVRWARSRKSRVCEAKRKRGFGISCNRAQSPQSS